MKILITGGSGLVGERLTELLIEDNHQVAHLSRSKREGKVKTYTWNVDDQLLEEGALNGVEAIVHLAGAGVADSRWTKSRKKEILDSRVKSTTLLCKELDKTEHQVKSVVAASAVGYYGMSTGDMVCIEGSDPGDDFLSRVVQEWEKETSAFRDLKIQTTQLRIGIVLDADGGALEKMVGPIKLGIGAPLGSGKQWMSWIHIDDLCRMIIFAIENQLDGVFNAVGPNPVTNETLTKALAQQFGKSLFLPNVPSFVLRMILGEMAAMVVGGNRVSPEKIYNAGFEYKYTEINQALKGIY